MKKLNEYIEKKQEDFTRHPFFARLQSCDSIDQLMQFSPHVMFWVMTFQDLLRLNEERIKDPYLHRIARHHRLEDSGHDMWFQHDLTVLYKNSEQYNVTWLFHEDPCTRDAAYTHIADVMTLEDEHLRVAFLLALESSGHIMFDRISKAVDKFGYSSQLKYFADSHLQVEKAHAVFEEEMERKLFAHELTPEQRYRGRAMIERMYTAYNTMFTALLKYFPDIPEKNTAESEQRK